MASAFYCTIFFTLLFPEIPVCKFAITMNCSIIFLTGRGVSCVGVQCTTVEYTVKTNDMLHTTALLISLSNAIYNDVYSAIIT